MEIAKRQSKPSFLFRLGSIKKTKVDISRCRLFLYCGTGVLGNIWQACVLPFRSGSFLQARTAMPFLLHRSVASCRFRTDTHMASNMHHGCFMAALASSLQQPKLGSWLLNYFTYGKGTSSDSFQRLAVRRRRRAWYFPCFHT